MPSLVWSEPNDLFTSSTTVPMRRISLAIPWQPSALNLAASGPCLTYQCSRTASWLASSVSFAKRFEQPSLLSFFSDEYGPGFGAGGLSIVDIRCDPSRLILAEQLGCRVSPRFQPSFSECMRRPVQQFDLSGQHRDTQVSLGAREVRLKCL